VSPSPSALWWVFLVATLALGVILFALGAAIVIYQRRFLALHRTYATTMLRAQEDERAWVAREVHDDALQRVALVVHELHDWSAEGPVVAERQQQRVDALRQEIEDLAVMLRRVAHRLHPALIDQAGLIPALQGLTNDVSRASGLSVEASLPNGTVPSLSRDHALLVYRIAQEALRNVAKHSGVKQARLVVAYTPEWIELTVSDQGRGFVTDDTARGRGLGLISMGERARLAGGALEIWSQPGSGTTIRVTVPLTPSPLPP
jgi:signal transduction histidine kinase